jgi:hypothetical protein
MGEEKKQAQAKVHFIIIKYFFLYGGGGKSSLDLLDMRIFWVSSGGHAMRCLVSIVEEVLRDIVFEDFVKSYKEGSKVTIVPRGGNKFDQFLDVAVYAVGGRRGMTLFS